MLKLLGEVVVGELQDLGEGELKAVIAQSERNISEQEEAKRGDEALARAKEDVRHLGSAYNDAIKFQRAKQRFASHLLQGR